jgi:glucose/arabinose dehydrogenase
MVNPILAFPAHLAPNDLMFYTGNMFPERFKNGAFIAFHGSWNRAPQEQKGYYVVFVPFNNEVPEGGWEIFADNFAKTDKIISPGDAKYRPTGLAQGSDGSVYITESNTGKIWRVLYEGK